MSAPPHAPPERTVFAVLASMALVVLDAGVVNVALPVIGGALGAQPAAAVLVVTAYQTGLVMALLPCGALGERFGHRRVFAWGIAVFTAASEEFNRRNTNAGIEESLQRFLPVMERAKADGVRVRGYVSTVLGCPYQGEVRVSDVARVAGRPVSYTHLTLPTNREV